MFPERQLGSTQTFVSAIGFGALPLSVAGRPPEERALPVLHHAIDSGISLIDTADSYCLDDEDAHHNERLIATVLNRRMADSASVLVATKAGMRRPRGAWVVDGHPERLRKAIAGSFQALGGKTSIGLWQLHACDPSYTIAEMLTPAVEAQRSGMIRFIGLSNVNAVQIEEARQVAEIVSVQNQFSPWCRRPERDGTLEYCRRERITFLCWSPLGGRNHRNLILSSPALCELAARKQVTVPQLILAWLLSKAPNIVPLVGTTQGAHLAEVIGSASIQLSKSDMESIDKRVPRWS